MSDESVQGQFTSPQREQGHESVIPKEAMPSLAGASGLRPAAVAPPLVSGWRRFGVGDLLFFALAYVIVQFSRGATLDDPGLGWHIRQIDAIFAERGWLSHDVFSASPMAGGRWLTNQWAGELPLWAADRWGGLNGLAAVSALLLAAAYRCLYGMLRADGVPWPAAFAWTWMAAMGSYSLWLVRPNFLSFWFLMLTARACDLYHRDKCSWRTLVWLAPLFALWANCHGSFVAGLVTLAAATTVEGLIAVLAFVPARRSAARVRAATMAAVTAAAFLATLLNPYGYELYPWIRGLVGNTFLMDRILEWKSPDFHASESLSFLLPILLFPLVLAVSRHRSSPVALVLAVLWLHMALNGVRFVALWIGVAVPLMARAALELPWWEKVQERLQLSDDLKQALRPPHRPAFAGALLVSVGFLIWGRWGAPFAFHTPEVLPTAALDRLIELADGEPAFHNYNWGGYLTWHGWSPTGELNGKKSFKTWVDDRNELYGNDHIVEYLEILDARPGWEEKLRGYKINWVCVPADPLAGSLLDPALRNHPDWELVYTQFVKSNGPAGNVVQTPVAVIYHRRAKVASGE